MSSQNAGAGRKLLSVIVFSLFAALAGFLVYEYTPFFKTPGRDADSMSGTHKIDKGALIANLEKKIRAIPANDVAANLDGYKRLLNLAPGNIRYKQKVDYYTARLKQTAPEEKTASAVREYIKIGFPAPRVLDRPDDGQMLGRVESGILVEILDKTVVASGSLITDWYQIKYGSRTGWISKLGTSGNIMAQPLQPEKTAAPRKKAAGPGPWEKLAATMIEDYGGKIISIDRLDIEESHFSLYTGMNPEQVRQTCENIGYYIRNSTGESPAVVVFIDGIPVARAESAGTKYQATLITK